MDGRPTWTERDEAGDYVVPNVFSPRDLVSRPDNMDETVPHTILRFVLMLTLLRAMENFIFWTTQNATWLNMFSINRDATLFELCR